jgi:hypothetical protein
MVQPRPYYVGSWVKVKHSTPYMLPDGLPEGASVKVIRFETGARVVEYRGKQFSIPMPCVDRDFIPYRE